MSAVETPPPGTPAGPEPRRCPRCGAGLTDRQEWCLACGADVGALIAAPRGWRVPVIVVTVLLAVAIGALALALVELAGNAETVTQAPPAALTPAPTPSPAAVQPSPTAGPSTTPGVSTAGIGAWPNGKTAWTVVLATGESRAAAEQRATELKAQGVAVGVLNSDDYPSLTPGSWVVFSGQYDRRKQAQHALTALGDKAQGAYVRQVAPK